MALFDLDRLRDEMGLQVGAVPIDRTNPLPGADLFQRTDPVGSPRVNRTAPTPSSDPLLRSPLDTTAGRAPQPPGELPGQPRSGGFLTSLIDQLVLGLPSRPAPTQAPSPPAQSSATAPIAPGFAKPTDGPGVAAGLSTPLTPSAFLSSVSGLNPTAEAFRQWWAQNQGPLTAAGYSFIDHPRDPALVLPDKTHIDVIQGAGGANPQWQWLVKSGVGGTAAPGFAGGVSTPIPFSNPRPPTPAIQQGLSANTFDDPATALLQSFLNFRMNELFDPVVDPRRQQFAADVESRIGQLREAPFTTAEESALRTSSQDEIERLRQDQQRNAIERLSQRGFLPTSGIAEQAAQDIDESFNTLRAQESAAFGQAAIDERQSRLDQALDLANALASMEGLARAEEDQRRNEILALASLGAELPERRLQLALATLGQQPPPGSLFNSVAAFGALHQDQQRLGLQQQLLNNQQNAAFAGGLGNLIAALTQPRAAGPAGPAVLPSTPFTFPVTGFPSVQSSIGIGSFL